MVIGGEQRGPSYAWQIEKPLEQNIGNTAMQVVTEELGETRLFHVHILSNHWIIRPAIFQQY